jgi:hypothetical protein
MRPEVVDGTGRPHVFCKEHAGARRYAPGDPEGLAPGDPVRISLGAEGDGPSLARSASATGVGSAGDGGVAERQSFGKTTAGATRPARIRQVQ